MKRSTERILTTHAGRLPNPDNIAAIMQARTDGDQVTFDRLMQAGIADKVLKQMEFCKDIHSDGEFWKARDERYYNSRATGVAMRLLTPGEGASILVHQQERHMPELREFYAIYDQIGNIPRPGVVNLLPTHKPVVAGPMQYKGQDAIKRELAVVRAGIAEARAQVENFFFPVLGPGWIDHFLFNAYYPMDEEYVYAMAEMFKGESDYSTYVKNRFTGFEGEPTPTDTGRDMLDFPEYTPFRRAGVQQRIRPKCNGPIAWKDFDAVRRDIDNLKAATGNATEVFMTAV